MVKIPLTRGLFALVDKDDADSVLQHKWYASKNGNCRFYARRGVNGVKIYLHRFLFPSTGGLVVDHINGDSLDNRRSNLRHCTRAQNIQNRRDSGTNKSGVIGVRWDDHAQKWNAKITYNKNVIRLGSFTDFDLAVESRREAGIRLFGEFSPLSP